jgi:hypothetical protein
MKGLWAQTDQGLGTGLDGFRNAWLRHGVRNELDGFRNVWLRHGVKLWSTAECVGLSNALDTQALSYIILKRKTARDKEISLTRHAHLIPNKFTMT